MRRITRHLQCCLGWGWCPIAPGYQVRPNALCLNGINWPKKRPSKNDDHGIWGELIWGELCVSNVMSNRANLLSAKGIASIWCAFQWNFPSMIVRTKIQHTFAHFRLQLCKFSTLWVSRAPNKLTMDRDVNAKLDILMTIYKVDEILSKGHVFINQTGPQASCGD